MTTVCSDISFTISTCEKYPPLSRGNSIQRPTCRPITPVSRQARVRQPRHRQNDRPDRAEILLARDVSRNRSLRPPVPAMLSQQGKPAQARRTPASDRRSGLLATSHDGLYWATKQQGIYLASHDAEPFHQMDGDEALPKGHSRKRGSGHRPPDLPARAAGSNCIGQLSSNPGHSSNYWHSSTHSTALRYYTCRNVPVERTNRTMKTVIGQYVNRNHRE